MAKFFTETEVAERLSLHPQTLRNWRHTGRGIPWVKMGSAVRYSTQAVEEYIEANTVRPEKAE